LYVAWIDRLFVDCFGLFHMVLTQGGRPSLTAPLVEIIYLAYYG